MPEFTTRYNRFGQRVTAEIQQAVYDRVLQELDALFGPGETYTCYTYDYRFVGKGKNARVEKYVVSSSEERKTERAYWYATYDLQG